ncbi:MULTISPECIES: hypothetical protein [unclassified Roseobacter]|uniref:hypothetical protein n=1 Tax=unclassified Roseobacter TaxID=196798 RepID=UPI0014912D90|nr:MULTISPECIES: hypothetical protein [unclassified Roseobacter]NNV30663.1 hypothetical protein [Roseobacter sp. HKCCD9061]NNX30732.1 hypothetical protein [Roseobacter sp. HKCCD6503]NNX34955.1 hypothetical protein [Roseobacter sp. HKCCD8418]NNX51994.1 hypothetical protein [Roseobacter sp. HKCCD9024]NNY28964.1 hypothetical protein [Roseobacter sp. HKCCD9199]NNY41844.1 hypothetical protein [Roseobacter sp. HKCCD8831]NNY50202.1 hypothetical protein [Roseobacter sp. HKCCD8190]NNY58923.1 hypothe
MNADDRQAAFDSVVAWYAWEMNAHKDRTPLYPTRYLSKRRWEDEGWQPPKPADPQAKLELWAKSIRDGTFVSPSVCPPQMCRAMIEAGLVTAEQVQARGLVA